MPKRQASNEAKNTDLAAIRSAPKGGRKTPTEAKKLFLKLLNDGNSVKEALRLVGYSESTYSSYWRKTDKEFAEQVDHIRGMRNRKRMEERVSLPDFPEFCETYLGLKLFWHQLQWYDVLEGRQPRDLHPAQRFIPGADPHMLLVNTPPGHAKTTTITVAYTLWRILKNPSGSFIVISKAEGLAKKFIREVKEYLTLPRYAKLQADFGPEGGFEKTSPVWSALQIYFGPPLRDHSSAHPTLEALGIGGTIYGARAELIILDDIADQGNAHQFEDQIDWLTRMVLTRPSDEDKVLIVGSRVAPVDIYRELMDPKRYDDDTPPWTYFCSPAVLEFHDDPEDWVTLWPRSNVPKAGAVSKLDEDGLYPKFDGPSLARLRKRLSSNPNAWTQGYQQEEVDEDSAFPRELVYGCVNGMRKVGPLVAGTPTHPESGMAGMRVIAGLDPASSGHTAGVVLAYDRETRKRWLLDAHNQANMTPQQLRALMIDWTQRYKVQEWRVEKVLLSQYITQDANLVRDLAALGATMHDHITNAQTKWDADGGILSLTGLIQGSEGNPKTNLLQLPSVQSEVIRALCEQMVTYYPKTKGKTDLLMALWFAEARIRQIAETTDSFNFMDSPFLSRQDRDYQFVVDLNDLDPDEPVFFSPYANRRAS